MPKGDQNAKLSDEKSNSTWRQVMKSWTCLRQLVMDSERVVVLGDKLEVKQLRLGGPGLGFVSTSMTENFNAVPLYLFRKNLKVILHQSGCVTFACS
jgi:hypothetical protein